MFFGIIMCFLKESAMLFLAKGYKIISISVCDFGRFVIVLCVSSLVKLKLRLQPAALPAGGGNSQFETWTLRKLASLRKLLLLWSKLCLSRYQGQGHAGNANQSKKTVFQIFQAQTNHRHTKYLFYVICHMLDIQTRQLQFEFTKTLPTLSPFLLGRKRRKVKVNWQSNLEYIFGNIHYLKEKKIPHQSGLLKQ